MNNISPKYFKLENGQIIKHVDELPEVLSRMEDSLFSKYVTDYKNDFSKWIYDVFKLEDLSQLLSNVKSKQEIVRILKAYTRSSMTQSEQVTNQPEQQVVVKTQQVQQPVQQTIQKNPEVQTNQPEQPADEYFQENPVLMSQIVRAKQKDFSVEPLPTVEFNDNQSYEIIIEILKKGYANTYERLTLLRKKGFDMSIPELMLFRIPGKIKLYEASKDNKDALIIKRYLNEVIEELNSTKL